MILIKGKLEKFNLFFLARSIDRLHFNFYKKVIFIGWLFLFSGCDGPNHDDFEQISCQEAQGLWMLSLVQCNGKLVDGPIPSIVNFEDSQTMHWTFGASSCQKTISNIYHLQGDLLDVFGTQFQVCKADGNSTASCNTQETTCTDTLPGSLVTHNVDSCVIEHGDLRLERRTSLELLSQEYNYCAAGEKEVLYYRQVTKTEGFVEFDVGNHFEFKTVDDIFPFNSTEPQRIVVSNPGLTDVNDLKFKMEAPFEFAGGSYPGQASINQKGSCGTSLPKASQCSLYIQFHPTEPGKAFFELPYSYNNGQGILKDHLSLEGFAATPKAIIKLVEDQITDFGTVVANGSKKLQIRLINIGSHTATGLRLSDETPPFYFSGSEGFPGSIPPGTCNQPLSPGNVCVIEFDFRPGGPGIFSHAFYLTYNNGLDLVTGFERTSLLEILLKGRAISND